MIHKLDDIALFNHFKSGNDEAFSTLYEIYAEKLLVYASTKLSSLDEARDLVHDLFVHLWEKRAQIDIQQSVKGYLFWSLNRRILNHYRRNSYQTQYADQLRKMEEQFFFGPDRYVEAKEIQSQIDEAVSLMPNKVREIYLLSREEHLSNAEIADRLNISQQTVKNQLSTAMSIIRKSIRYAILLFNILFLSQSS